MDKLVLIAALAAVLMGTLQAVQAAPASPGATPVVCVTDGCTTDVSGKTGR